MHNLIKAISLKLAYKFQKHCEGPIMKHFTANSFNEEKSAYCKMCEKGSRVHKTNLIKQDAEHKNFSGKNQNI